MNAVSKSHSTRWLAALLSLLGAAVLTGCSDGRPARAPVSGQVLIDGQPLTCGYLRLIPTDTRPAGGRIGPDGRFQLGCFEKQDGSPLGTHKVTVIAQEVLDSHRMRWHAPKKYIDAETSGLTATIDGPTDSLTIELTWAGGKPFVESVDSGE